MSERTTDQSRGPRSEPSVDEPDRRLTRRRLLAGISSAGILGAVAGRQTMAVFSDTETLAENGVSGSELDLRLAWRETHNGELLESIGACGGDDADAYVDNEEAVLTFDEAEPGDRGSIAACVSPLGSDVSLWVRLTLVDAAENGITAVEERAGDETPERGELQDNLLVTVREQTDCSRPDGSTAPLASGVVSDVVSGPLGSGRKLESRCLSLVWELPDDVPPTVLSDSIAFALEFTAAQSRENTTQQNPWNES